MSLSPMISRWPSCRPLPVQLRGSSAVPLCGEGAHASRLRTTSAPSPHSAPDVACARRCRRTSPAGASPASPCRASLVAASPLGRRHASLAVATSRAGPRHREGGGESRAAREEDGGWSMAWRGKARQPRRRRDARLRVQGPLQLPLTGEALAPWTRHGRCPHGTEARRREQGQRGFGRRHSREGGLKRGAGEGEGGAPDRARGPRRRIWPQERAGGGMRTLVASSAAPWTPLRHGLHRCCVGLHRKAAAAQAREGN